MRRWVIYLAYGAALVLGGMLIGWGVLRPAPAVLAIAVLLALGATDTAEAQAPRGGPVPPTIRTVPAAPGMRFVLDGHRFEADRAGRATPPAAFRRAGASLRALDTEVAPGVRARFDRWYSGRRIAALNLYHRVGISFVDLGRERRRSQRRDVGDLAGQRREPARACGRSAGVAAGQPGRAREPGQDLDTALLLGGPGARSRFERREPRPAALLPCSESERCGCGCCCSRSA